MLRDSKKEMKLSVGLYSHLQALKDSALSELSCCQNPVSVVVGLGFL